MIYQIIKEFDIPSATAQQRRFGGRGKTWQSPSLKAANAAWQAFFEAHKPKTLLKPLACALRLTVYLWYGTKDKSKWGEWKTTRPDADNLLKVIQDAMQKAGYFIDDAQVQPCIERCWGEKSMVMIVISTSGSHNFGQF